MSIEIIRTSIDGDSKDAHPDLAHFLASLAAEFDEDENPVSRKLENPETLTGLLNVEGIVVGPKTIDDYTNWSTWTLEYEGKQIGDVIFAETE